MSEGKYLNDMGAGDKAVVAELLATGNMRRRLLDVGLAESTELECLGRSPGGDPAAFMIRGAVIAIRSEDCAKVRIVSGGEGGEDDFEE